MNEFCFHVLIKLMTAILYAGFLLLWPCVDCLLQFSCLDRKQASNYPDQLSFFRLSVDYQHDMEYGPSLVKAHQSQKRLWSVYASRFTKQIILLIFCSLCTTPSSCWTASWEFTCTSLYLVSLMTSYSRSRISVTTVSGLKISYVGLKSSLGKRGVSILTPNDNFCVPFASDLQ